MRLSITAHSSASQKLSYEKHLLILQPVTVLHTTQISKDILISLTTFLNSLLCNYDWQYDCKENRPQPSFRTPKDAQESRQSRKRSKSQQSSRSRGSRSNSASKSSPRKVQHGSEDQPEYINISSLEQARTQSTADLSVVPPALSADENQQQSRVNPASAAEWNKRAIGPDAWYNDDFNYDKAQHSFADDPILNQQYGQLLDLRYRMVQDAVNPPPPPPKAYRTGRGDLETMDPSTAQLCHDVEMEHKPVVSPSKRKPSKQTLADKGRSKTWHADQFAEQFQIMKKRQGDNSKAVFLTVKKDPGLGRPMPKRSLDSSTKEPWSPHKAIDQIRKAKEAPPKNVVQDRRQKFETSPAKMDKTSGKVDDFNLKDIDSALEELEKAKEVEDKQRKMSGLVKDFALSDSKDSSDDKGGNDSDNAAGAAPNAGGKPGDNQKKRSVKELLSDFERKSLELQEQEEISTSRSSRRRVFSDTETMMYDTSSDEDDSTFDASNKKTISPSRELKDSNRKTSLPTLPSAITPFLAVSDSEAQYLKMANPPPSMSMSTRSSRQEDQYLQMKVEEPRSSPPKGVQRTSGVGSELQKHERTPSQSLVIEHLSKELGPERAAEIIDTYLAQEQQQGPESPRYCEIEEPATSKGQSQEASVPHYEYLFKATTATNPNLQTAAESLYQEIPDEDKTPTPSPYPGTQDPSSGGAGGLPDILGNAPTGRGHSSSDADDEGHQSARESHPGDQSQQNKSLFDATGTFTTASFFLDKSPAASAQKGPSTPSSKARKGSQNSLNSRELPQTPVSYKSSNEDLQQRQHPQQFQFPHHGSRGSLSSQDDSSGRGHPRSSLGNIKEVPYSLERKESGSHIPPGLKPHHSILKQNISLTYQSVYDNDELGFSSSSSNDPPKFHKVNSSREGSMQRMSSSSDMELKSKAANNSSLNQSIPYYVADISSKRETSSAVDQKTSSTSKLIMAKRRAQTPDSFLLEQGQQQALAKQADPHQRQFLSPTSMMQVGQDGVMRSKSLEGLLGDGHAGMRDAVQVTMYPPTDHSNAPTPVNVLPLSPTASASRSTPLPARGRDPPPPPPGVPPLDLTQFHGQGGHHFSAPEEEQDDDSWRESLRRASAKQRARSMDMLEQEPQPQQPQQPQQPPPPLIQPGPYHHQQQLHVQPHGGQVPHHPQLVPHPMMSPLASGYTPMIPGAAAAHTYGNMEATMPAMSPHITGYVWDERYQRFYRLNDNPTSPPNPRLFSSHQQPFLDQGLPSHTDSDLQQQRQQRPRPKSVGPESRQNKSNSMMGRPKSTLPYQSPNHYDLDHQTGRRRHSLASSNTSATSFSRTPRTSQSGLPDERYSPVPPSPAVGRQHATFFPDNHAPSPALFSDLTTQPPSQQPNVLGKYK